jgi:hypothetical protein
MNRLATLALSVVAALFTLAANALPVTYQFAGLHTREVTGANVLVDSANYLFTAATPIVFTFTYDRDTAVTVSNVPTTGALVPYGRMSSYADSLSNISGTVGGYSFSATAGDTTVANSNPGDATLSDGIFNMIGTFAGGPVGSGFSGFTIGDFALISAAQYSIGSSGYLPDQSLPNLSNGQFNTGVNLVFADSGNNQRIVQFWNGNIAPVSSVPLPAAAWLFGGALLGLAGVGRRRRAA